LNGRCPPEETIPIRRTKKDNVLRASSIESYGKKKHLCIPQPNSSQPDQTTHKSPTKHAACISLSYFSPFYFNKKAYTRVENLPGKKNKNFYVKG
jgi:hypothetical protein